MYNCISDKIFSPQQFIDAVIGPIYKFTEADNDDKITAIHNVLRHFDKEDDHLNTIWDYPLSEIDEIVTQDVIVVLVDVSHYEDDKYITEYRWFQVPSVVAQPDKFEFIDDISID